MATWLPNLLRAAWALALLLPTFSGAAYANGWSVAGWQPVAVTAWLVAAGWAFLPRSLLLVGTLPVVLAGVAVLVADYGRGVDALELLSVAYTFRREEVVQALAPYRAPALIAAGAVLAAFVFLWRSPAQRPSRHARVALALCGVVLLAAVPQAAWRAAWPGSLLGAALEGSSGDTGLPATATAHARVSPRDRFASWGATRAVVPAQRETYVLVIGESLRSDRIPGCGGRAQVTAAPDGALLFCDMLAGASGTHAAVPLLVSRELPGAADRVPRDATFLRAFGETGFETFWLAVQERMIAWPDAHNQVFDPVPALDRQALLPLVDQALARAEPRKALVVHAYGAHAPYRDRYETARAPFPVDRARANGMWPERAAMDQWWNDYDNAVDESLRFLREVVARVEAAGGESVVVFTPDHGENMLDDARQLTAHALKRPTWWDTRVPLIVWASPSWRAAHPDRWQQMMANRGAPLMHMDVVPTLLGAAGIRYQEPRRAAIDLGARLAPPGRQRFAQLRAGMTVNEETLRREAGQLDPR